MVHLTSHLEDAVIEKFDGILPKLGVDNWENVLKFVDFVEHWRCLLWAKAFVPFF